MNRRFFAPANKRRIPGSFNRTGALLVLGLLAFASLVGTFGALRPESTSAASSTTLTFQARLLNTSGSLVADGTYNVEFKIYDTVGSGASAQGVCSLDSSTDDCWWLETRTGANKVTVKNGYVYANLGSVTAFSSTIPWDQELWITMNIGGTGAPSWDGEMSPRFKVAAVPYAFAAAKLQVTDSAITNKLVFATPASSNKTITLPNETGTVCTTGSVCSGYVSSTSGFMQGGNSFAATAILGTNDANDLQLETGGTTKLTVQNSTGNVGIGTISPNSKLNVLDGTVAELRFNSGASNVTPTLAVGNTSGSGKFAALIAGTTGGAFFYDASGTFSIYSAPKSDYTGNSLGSSGTARLFIDTTGNVGIGDTTPASLFTVGTGDLFQVNSSGAIAASTGIANSGGYVQSGSTANTLTGATSFNGNLTIGDAIGDTVTINSGAWTFANDTTVALTGGVNALNFDSDTLSIDSTNNRVGIGNAAPLYTFDLLSGTVNTGTGGYGANPAAFSVTAPDLAIGGAGGSTLFTTNDNFAVDKGGSIAFGGRYSTASANDTVFGKIKGAKENSTSGNFNGYVVIATYNHNAGAIAERLRVDSSGNLGLGTSSIGTSGAVVLALGQATAPSTSPTDVVQLYVTDAGAGDARLRVRMEGGGIVSFPNETGTVCTTGSVCSGYQASGSYANTALSNLSGVAINTALLTGADNTIDLGSTSFSFRTLYADTSVLTPALDVAAAGALTIGNTTATSVSVCNSAACDTLTLGNNADADTITLGDTLDTFSLGSSAFNVSTSGALTGVTTLNASGLVTSVGLTAGAGLIQGTNGLTIAGTTSIGATAGNVTGLGNSTGALILTGNSSSTLVLNGTTLSAAELNLLDGHDVALVDTNDAVATAIVGTGALNAGSITSGFGAIDIGADTITSGAINSQTISSAANFTGTLAVNGASVTVGTASATNGTLVLQNSTNAFTTTLTAPNTAASSKTITLPNETGTVCTTGSICSGYASTAGYATISLNNIASTNLSAALNVTSGNLALQTTTSGNITLTPAASSGLINVLTGNLQVGNGTPGVTLNGEDLYVEGTLEVDGAQQFDGALVANSTATFNGNLTVGDASGDTVTVNSGAWTFANDTTVALSGGVNGINFDSNTLSIDATNNRIGIGTAAPSQLLHLAATGDTAIRFQTQSVAGTQTNSGAVSPGTTANDATVGQNTWSNLNNAKVSDNTYSVASPNSGDPDVTSQYLKATNFGFSIPAGATIDGIVVEIERNAADVGDSIVDSRVRIVKANGSIGTTNKADLVTSWPTSDAYKSYGSSSDVWGETWTYSDINDVDFGVVLSVEAVNPGTNNAYVDHMRITVYYTATADVDWAAGGDHSDGGKFKIAGSSSLGSSDYFTIATSGNVGIGTTAPTAKLEVAGDIQIGKRTDSGGAVADWSKISGTTAGTITSAGRTSIDVIRSFANYNGSLYAGTQDADGAEIYRYDGGTTWTKVSQSTAGTIASGGTASIDTIRVMTVFNGYLYVGTNEANSAEVYRYDGGTTWTKVTQATAGTIASAGTASIDGINSITVYEGSLYIGTSEATKAEIYRYDGGTTWTKANTTTGTFDSTASIDTVDTLTVANGQLFAGIAKANSAEVYRYNFGTVWTLVSNTAGTITSGGTASIDVVHASAVYNGALYIGTSEGASAEIYKFISTVNGSHWVKVSQATAGTIASGGTASIDTIRRLVVYNGKLYASTSKANAAEVYRYDEGTTWTKVTNSTAGTVSTSGTANIDTIHGMIEFDDKLIIGTSETNLVEIYSYSSVEGLSYALNFNAASDNANAEQGTYTNKGIIRYQAEGQGNAYQSAGPTGSFLFSAGITTTFGAYDLAEDYATRDDSLTAGDILVIDPSEKGFVKKSSGLAYDKQAIGIYSTNPALRLSQADAYINGGQVVPVALAGRVPVKVTNENGPIIPGDYITTSSRPGYGMKATSSGQVIGKALEAFNSTEGTVMVFINITSITPNPNELLASGELTSLTVSGPTRFGEVTVTGNVQISGRLTVIGLTEVGDIKVRGKIITEGSAPTVVLGATTTGEDSSYTIEGNDTAGSITITTGTSTVSNPLASGEQAVLTFVTPFTTTPRITITPTTEAAANIKYYITKSGAEFKLHFTAAPDPNSTYSFDYQVLQ